MSKKKEFAIGEEVALYREKPTLIERVNYLLKIL